MTTPHHVPTELASLAASVEGGTLRLEPGVAERCIAACDRFRDDLTTLEDATGWMSTRPAYGSLASAQQLGAKFESKAIGPNGLHDVLQQHINTVQHLRDLFDKAARAYHDADAHAAETLANNTGGS